MAIGGIFRKKKLRGNKASYILRGSDFTPGGGRRWGYKKKCCLCAVKNSENVQLSKRTEKVCVDDHREMMLEMCAESCVHQEGKLIQVCGDKEIRASEPQGEAVCGERSRKGISRNRKNTQVWKLEGFAHSVPNRLSDPWVLCTV